MSNLRHDASINTRRLLMISHCMPQRGPGPRGRAWQLLSAATRSHDVFLLAQADAPITLAEWRATENKTHRMALATGRTASALCTMASAWVGDTPFDAVVCTTPRLLKQTLTIPAAQRICDAANKPAHGFEKLRNLWLTRRAAAQANVVLNRGGISAFLDALAMPTQPAPALLRQAA